VTVQDGRSKLLDELGGSVSLINPLAGWFNALMAPRPCGRRQLPPRVSWAPNFPNCY
jgi:hypothetical protein